MAAAGSEIQMATVARSGGQQQGSVEAGPHQQDHQQQIQQELLVQPLQLPAGGNPTPEFALHMQQVLLSASERGVSALHQVLPPNVLSQILKKTRTILDAEPTLVEVGRECNPATHTEVTTASAAVCVIDGSHCH